MRGMVGAGARRGGRGRGGGSRSVPEICTWTVKQVEHIKMVVSQLSI